MSRETFEAWFYAPEQKELRESCAPGWAYRTWQAAIASMKSERDQLAVQLKQSQIDAECYKRGMDASNKLLADVVAENAALKGAIQSHSESVHFCELCGKDDPCSTDDVCYVLKETPATDRFIAEQRAFGVEMFAKVLRVPGDDAFMDAIAVGVAGAADNFAAQLRNEVKA